MALTFGKMEGSLRDGRSADVLLDGSRIGSIEANAIGTWTGTASGAETYRVASYSVDLDDEYGIDASHDFDTLKQARDAVRAAVARRFPGL